MSGIRWSSTSVPRSTAPCTASMARTRRCARSTTREPSVPDVLWVCLLLPDLPLEIFTRAHEDANAALRFAITTAGHHPRIVIANAGAQGAGIARGQLVSAAYALAPDVVLRERDEAAEHGALARVAAWLTQYTPMVSIATPQAVLAEISGSLHLFGG